MSKMWYCDRSRQSRRRWKVENKRCEVQSRSRRRRDNAPWRCHHTLRPSASRSSEDRTRESRRTSQRRDLSHQVPRDTDAKRRTWRDFLGQNRRMSLQWDSARTRFCRSYRHAVEHTKNLPSIVHRSSTRISRTVLGRRSSLNTCPSSDRRIPRDCNSKHSLRRRRWGRPSDIARARCNWCHKTKVTQPS